MTGLGHGTVRSALPQWPTSQSSRFAECYKWSLSLCESDKFQDLTNFLSPGFNAPSSRFKVQCSTFSALRPPSSVLHVLPSPISYLPSPIFLPAPLLASPCRPTPTRIFCCNFPHSGALSPSVSVMSGTNVQLSVGKVSLPGHHAPLRPRLLRAGSQLARPDSP